MVTTPAMLRHGVRHPELVITMSAHFNTLVVTVQHLQYNHESWSMIQHYTMGTSAVPIHTFVTTPAMLRRGIRHPELVIARSAHAAYYKAAEYFKMRLVTLPVGKDLRMSGGWGNTSRCLECGWKQQLFSTACSHSLSILVH